MRSIKTITPKKELNLWVMPNAGFATRSVLNPFIQEFEKLHPEVEVKLTIHPWSTAWTRLMDVIKGRYLGPKPDVLQIGTTHVATLAFLKAIDNVPNDHVLPEDDKMSAYIWDPGVQGESGKDMFCVPWFIDVRVLYYRRDLFEQLNLTPDLLNDWKGFFHVCSVIQQYVKRSGPIPKIIAPLAIPGQKPAVLMHDLAPWIWEAGGDFCSDDLVQAKLNSAESLKGCEFYFDLISEGFMPITDSLVHQGNFFTGHYAMQFSGSWPGSTYLNPQSPLAAKEVIDGYDVALLPAGPRGRFTFLGGSNLAVFSGSQNKEISWDLIRFLSHPARQLSHAKSIGMLTARLGGFDDLFQNNPAAKKIFWDSLGHARRLPRLVELGSVEQIVYKLGEKVLAMVRANQYSHKKLFDEINNSNNGIAAVLSLHKYGLPLMKDRS